MALKKNLEGCRRALVLLIVGGGDRPAMDVLGRWSGIQVRSPSNFCFHFSLITSGHSICAGTTSFYSLDHCMPPFLRASGNLHIPKFPLSGFQRQIFHVTHWPKSPQNITSVYGPSTILAAGSCPPTCNLANPKTEPESMRNPHAHSHYHLVIIAQF